MMTRLWIWPSIQKVRGPLVYPVIDNEEDWWQHTPVPESMSSCDATPSTRTQTSEQEYNKSTASNRRLWTPCFKHVHTNRRHSSIVTSQRERKLLPYFNDFESFFQNLVKVASVSSKHFEQWSKSFRFFSTSVRISKNLDVFNNYFDRVLVSMMRLSSLSNCAQ